MFKGLRTLVFGNYDDETQESVKEIPSQLGETRQILPSVEEQEKEKLNDSQRQQQQPQQSTAEANLAVEQHNVDGKLVCVTNNYDDESWELLDYEQSENVDNKTRLDNGKSIAPSRDIVVNGVESNIELHAQSDPELKHRQNVEQINANVEVANAATAKQEATTKIAIKKSDAKSKSTKKIDTALATKIERNVTGRAIETQLVTPSPPPPPPSMPTTTMSSGLKRQRPVSSSWSTSSDSEGAESSDFSDCDYSYGGAMASLRGSSNKSTKSRVRSTLTSITKERQLIKSNQQAVKQAQQLKPRSSTGINTESAKDCQVIATVVNLASDEPTIVNNLVPAAPSSSGTKQAKKKRVSQDQNAGTNNKNCCAMPSVQFQSSTIEDVLDKGRTMLDTKLIDDQTTAKAMNSSSIVSSNDSSDAAMDDSWYVTPPPCFNGPLTSSKISIADTNATNASTIEKQTFPIVEGEKSRENIDFSANKSSIDGVNSSEAALSQELAGNPNASVIDEDNQAELEKLLKLENLLIEHPSMFIPKPARYGSHQRPKQRIRSQQNNSVSDNVPGKTKDIVDTNVAKLTKLGSANNKNELKQQKLSLRVTVAKGPTSSTTDLMAPPPIKASMSKAKRHGVNKAKARDSCIKPVVSNVIELNISGGKPVSSSSTSSSLSIASSKLKIVDKSKSSTVANPKDAPNSALVISASKVQMVKSSSLSAKSFLKTPMVKLVKNKIKTKRNGTASSNKVKQSMKDDESSPVKLIASRSLEAPVKVANPIVEVVKSEKMNILPSIILQKENFTEQQNEDAGWQSELEDDSFSSSSSVIADVNAVVGSNISYDCESSDDDEAVSGTADNDKVCLTSIVRISNDEDISVSKQKKCSIDESKLVSMDTKHNNEPSLGESGEEEEDHENNPPSRVLQHQRREARISQSDTRLPHWQKCKRRGRQRLGELHRNLLANAKVSDSSKCGSYSPMVSMLAAEKVSSMSSLSGTRDRTRSPPTAHASVLCDMMKMTPTANEFERPLLSTTSNSNSKILADNSTRAARLALQRQLAKSSTTRHNQVAVKGSNTRRADRRARMAQRPNGCSVNRKVHTNFPKN